MKIQSIITCLLALTIATGCSDFRADITNPTEAGLAAAKGGNGKGKGGNNGGGDDGGGGTVSFNFVEFRVDRVPAGVDPRVEGWSTFFLPDNPEYIAHLLLEEDVNPTDNDWNWLYVHIKSATPLSFISANVALDRNRDGKKTSPLEWIHYTGAIHGHVNDDISNSPSDLPANYGGQWDDENDNVYEYKGYLHRPWIGQVNDLYGTRIQYPDQYNYPDDYPGKLPGMQELDPFVFVFGARLADGSSRSGLRPPVTGADQVAMYAGPDPQKLIYALVSDVSTDTRKVRGKMKTIANWTVSFPSIAFTTLPPVDRDALINATTTEDLVYSIVYYTIIVGGQEVQSGSSSPILITDRYVNFSLQVDPGKTIEFRINNVIARQESGSIESWDPNPDVNDLYTQIIPPPN